MNYPMNEVYFTPIVQQSESLSGSFLLCNSMSLDHGCMKNNRILN